MSRNTKIAEALASNSPTGNGCASSKVQPKQREPEVPATLVPELRFPEFEGVWTEKTFGNLFKQRQEKGDEDLPLLSLTAEQGIIPQSESGRKDNSNADKSRYLKVVEGDIAYNTMRMWEGRSALSTLEGLVSPAYTVCAPKKGINSTFFSFYIKTPSLIEEFNKNSQGLTKDTFSLKYPSFAKIKVSTPSSAEQQKIADCLGSLDDLIAAHRRKLAALQDHKKGLLQQLFPSEGQTTPKLRFPGFEGEWRKEKAGKLFSNRRQKGREGLPIYSVSQAEGLVERSTQKRKVDDIADPAGNKAVFKGDLAYNMMRMWQGAVGVAGEDCMISPAYIVLSPNKHVVSDFYGYYFKTLEALQLFEGHSRGLTKDRLRLYYEDFSRIALPVTSKEEQQKIADCLSTLDALITAQTEQIAALKTHKKGLMQKLFPIES